MRHRWHGWRQRRSATDPVIAVGIAGLVAAALVLTLSPFRKAVMPAAYTDPTVE